MKKQKIEAEGGENLCLNSIGIYFIKSTIDDRLYIGSSKNIGKRLKHHFNALNRNKHANTHLQNYYNKYGISSLKCGIFTECSEDTLIEIEQVFIDKHNTNYRLFNISKIAGKVDMNAEVREKIRSKSLGKIITKEQREKARQNSLGKRHSDKTKELLRQKAIVARRSSINYNFKGEKNNQSKLKDCQVVEILELLKQKIKGVTIAKKYNVSIYCISLIKRNKSYIHILR
jgi:group I intron endonuclease